ncbi:hypothetical protein MmTuc01_0497 [Methanosarcina mazei Tuc01]|uniref:Uncharacterized protein n=1 Tax=Methanosarcina mazei Tuc01 TaxID=1236903 RepID=M1QG15_METMZ|nr:hypothetical protein MmTuc01_0497 [Methanosarcina mazei Tuc01]
MPASMDRDKSISTRQGFHVFQAASIEKGNKLFHTSRKPTDKIKNY